MNTKPNIPNEFADFYYLRSIDLIPERLSEYRGKDLDIDECRKLYKQGFLFMNRDDALRIREIMRIGQINEILRIKGTRAVLVELDCPLCP